MNARTLTVSWDDPMPGARQAASMSGREYLAAIMDGKFPAPPIAKLVGFRLAQVGDGLAVFECTPGEQHYNPIGVVHGGLACTLLDSAMGCAVHTTLSAGTAYTTLEVKVNLVRAITTATGLLRAEGRVIHAGKRMATAEGRLIDSAGKLYAHGTTTCMVFPQARA
ncbi:MAG: PaaI family thioesterase [Burkholderiales bacterium]